MKIARSTALVVALITALGVGLFGYGSAAAQNGGNGSIIQCGLWTGANLYYSTDCIGNNGNSAGSPNQGQPGTPQQNGSPTNSQIYAGLGDSVAAGLGLPGVSGGTSQDVQCGRSPQAYPYIVAQSLGLSLVHQACSGATVGDLFTQQHTSGANPQAQLNAAFAQGTPRLISITAGANDAHWASFIRACYSGTCDTSSSTLAANAFLVSLQTKLYYAFYSIQSRSSGGPLPRVVVTGYYNPVSVQCANTQQRITPSEITWLTNETNALNQTLQNVTAQFGSFATFAPINFSGHDMCSSSPWVQGLNDNAPFHPTAVGQQVIARSVLNAAR